MSKLKQLQKIKELYERGGNLMQYFRDQEQSDNDTESILISYDFQAGSYIDYICKQIEYTQKRSTAIAELCRPLKSESILEVGVGEATTLFHLAQELGSAYKYYGFDLSWSRVRYAKSYCEQDKSLDISLFTGDLFHAPLKDNSVDIVYTSHTLEPNRGREKEALKELYRISRKYLILLEPSYELASKEAQERMDFHGYIKGLPEVLKDLGYKVLRQELFPLYANPLNPTGLTIIEKEPQQTLSGSPYACPVTGASLACSSKGYYSPESLLAYPILDEIPCLLPQNAIVASHFQKFIHE